MSQKVIVTEGRVEEFCKGYCGDKFHALLCDPPYNLAFMGKDWDKGGIAFKPETWAALATHLLPGAFGMTFASSRGWHRVACAIEDAGLRLHPTIFCWAFGSGFPKASRLDRQIDKAAGATPKVVGQSANWRESKRDREKFGSMEVRGENAGLVTEPTTKLARAWAGHRYGLQALKPAVEPIIVFQKPYEGKPMDSIVKHGAGALNIEAGRVSTAESLLGGAYAKKGSERYDGAENWRFKREGGAGEFEQPSGRWPANFALQHHPDCRRMGIKQVKNPSGSVTGNEPSKPATNVYGEYGRHSFERHADANGIEMVEEWKCVESCPVRKLDEQSDESKSTKGKPRGSAKPGKGYGMTKTGREHADAGGASRFFFNSDWNAEVEEGILSADPVKYCAKAPRKERNAGLEERCKHPTMKPIKLCRWLARLLLPPEQYAPRRLLVPFAGVGSEMIAAALEGWQVLGIEAEAEYVDIAKARLNYWLSQDRQGALWPK